MPYALVNQNKISVHKWEKINLANQKKYQKMGLLNSNAQRAVQQRIQKLKRGNKSNPFYRQKRLAKGRRR